jgi:hypothetical protein
MFSVYAVYGSELHLILPDDFADAVIRAQDAMLRSDRRQRLFTQSLGIEWTEVERDAWNEFAALMNQLIKINDGALHLPNEINDALILVKLHYIGES